MSVSTQRMGGIGSGRWRKGEIVVFPDDYIPTDSSHQAAALARIARALASRRITTADARELRQLLADWQKAAHRAQRERLYAERERERDDTERDTAPIDAVSGAVDDTGEVAA